LKHHPARSGPRRSHFHEPGTGRGVVVCAQKNPRLLDLDCLVPQDTSSGRLCCGGSENKGASTVVGGHARQLSCWSLFHGFLGSVSGGPSMPKQHTAAHKGSTAPFPYIFRYCTGKMLGRIHASIIDNKPAQLNS